MGKPWLGPSELPPPLPQDRLQDCLPPQPWAGPRPASLCLLPRLEEDQRAARVLWSRCGPLAPGVS